MSRKWTVGAKNRAFERLVKLQFICQLILQLRNGDLIYVSA
jgi:hypothetical protein